MLIYYYMYIHVKKKAYVIHSTVSRWHVGNNEFNGLLY